MTSAPRGRWTRRRSPCPTGGGSRVDQTAQNWLWELSADKEKREVDYSLPIDDTTLADLYDIDDQVAVLD